MAEPMERGGSRLLYLEVGVIRRPDGETMWGPGLGKKEGESIRILPGTDLQAGPDTRKGKDGREDRGEEIGLSA